MAGFVAHFYKLTNWLPNWDSLVFRYDKQNMLELGRWFLSVAAAPSSYYDLPWLAGLMTIVFYALGAVCICRMFEVRKNMTAALIGATVVSFPNVTSVLMYNYVADAYALSFLLACIAAFLMTREKPPHILCVVLIAFSAGIYQAYLTVSIMLLLCYLIRLCLQRDANIKVLLLRSVRFLVTGILGVVLYYGILMVLLKITGTSLLDYQGMNKAVSVSSIDLWDTLYVVKESFFKYFLDFSNGLHVFGVMNAIVFTGIVMFTLEDILRKRVGIWQLWLLGVYVIALPLGATILSFLNSSIDYHNLMTIVLEKTYEYKLCTIQK